MTRRLSIWGTVDSEQVFAEGLVLVSTPSHGGFILSEEMNARIPQSLKEMSFCQQGLDGYYEEDEDWSIVVSQLPEYFEEDLVEQARITAKALVKRKLEKTLKGLL
jgi:hypothetical protein